MGVPTTTAGVLLLTAAASAGWRHGHGGIQGTQPEKGEW
jgi:hypothetical protein